MVELALRALFESASPCIAGFWNQTQKNLEANVLPEEMNDHYLKGCQLVWQQMLSRLCGGCMGKDSENIFYQWLGAYRQHLLKASSKDEGAENPYIKGQVDAFNSYLRAFSRLSKDTSQAYKQKTEEIETKRKELEGLQFELEKMIWDFVAKPEVGNQEVKQDEVPSM